VESVRTTVQWSDSSDESTGKNLKPWPK